MSLPATASTEASAEAAGEVAVRRWEHVIIVRAPHENLSRTVGRAEALTMIEGGAVLGTLLKPAGPNQSDFRMLVRTRRPGAVGTIAKKIRVLPGVIGATVAPLPETPTLPGGPSFISSYQAGLGGEPEPGVLVQHDVEPVLGATDLLEAVGTPSSPLLGPDSQLGGVGVNISALIKRMRESAWRRREERMRNANLPVAPPATSLEAEANKN
ncbi:MAG: hypothetical protein AAF533_29525 [Acidobacteriota bacterium]